MKLSKEQLLAIAPIVLPTEPCGCGCLQVRIEPELRNGRVEVKCVGCNRTDTFAAAGLVLAPAVVRATRVERPN